MAVFRVQKTQNYTIMSNHHLRNKALSLKAKGLLSLMLSLPEDWDYTTRGLASICKEGVDSVCATVRELEAAGYIIRRRIRDKNGQMRGMEYTVLEQPQPPEQDKPSCAQPKQAKPNPNLHRIRAVTDLTEDVLAGMLGGYVESYNNLDQEGRAWISEDAIACENAVVCGDAVLTDHAVARGNAYVGNNAMMTGHAIAQDDAAICGGLLTGKSCVCGYAVIRQDEQTLCAPIIDGSARVYGEISGNVVCRGDAVVLPGTKLDNRTQDCFVLEDDRVSVQTASRTPPPKEPRTHDFER